MTYIRFIYNKIKLGEKRKTMPVVRIPPEYVQAFIECNLTLHSLNIVMTKLWTLFKNASLFAK